MTKEQDFQEYLRKCGYFSYERKFITSWEQAHKLVYSQNIYFALGTAYSVYKIINHTPFSNKFGVKNHVPFFDDELDS